MTGPKLTAMILFGALSLLFGFLFSVGLVGGIGGVFTGLVVAAATCALIWFAPTGKLAFARGFLALGAVFIVVPVVSLGGWAEQVGEGTIDTLTSGGTLSEEETTEFVLTSIFASAGLIFGMIVGLLLVLIGGLMHAGKRADPPQVPPLDQ